MGMLKVVSEKGSQHQPNIMQQEVTAPNSDTMRVHLSADRGCTYQYLCIPIATDFLQMYGHKAMGLAWYTCPPKNLAAAKF